MQQNNQQENRFLESPYVIRETNPVGQHPFSVKNPVQDGFIFSKKGFSTKNVETVKNSDQKSKREVEEEILEQ